MNPRYVSRGGEKLASVAKKLKLNFRGKVVLDVGSSTGGFTDFALQNGAKKVYAIDVGTKQLDGKLRGDNRVILMEKTDIRSLRLRNNELGIKNKGKPLNSKFIILNSTPDIVLIDVSFISLKPILPAIARLISPKTDVVAMAKPHFEADSKAKHKGVIKNDRIRRDILKQVEEFMRRQFVIVDKADSEILGRKGNKERFYLLRLAAKTRQ